MVAVRNGAPMRCQIERDTAQGDGDATTVCCDQCVLGVAKKGRFLPGGELLEREANTARIDKEVTPMLPDHLHVCMPTNHDRRRVARQEAINLFGRCRRE